MNEKRFFGRTFSKVMSWMLAIAIIFSMTPANFALVAEAAAGAVTSTDLTVHFKNEREWGTVYGKFGAGENWEPVSGYEFCKNNEFGGIINENSANSGWYTYRIIMDDAATVNGLFNCGAWGGENQTENYSISITDEAIEVWITSNGISYDEPDSWDKGFTAEAPVNPADLSSVKSPVINEDGSVTFNYEISASQLGGNKLYLMGDEPLSNWDPGIEMQDEDGDSVYSVTIPEIAPGKYGYKFKYGGTWVRDPLNSKTIGDNSLLAIEGPLTNKVIDNNNGTTKFVTLTESKEAVVKLVYGNKDAVESDVSALKTITMSLAENGSYETEDLFFGDDELDIVYYYIVNDVEGILDDSNETVVIKGVNYSHYTRKAFTGRGTNVPGTFPGPSWEVNSNVMHYEGNGLYTYTFKDVPPANYDYKIAHGSWNENYGAKGKPDGENIKVTVKEKQDVTIYYSDFSHYSRTSVDYEFGADIKLTGTGFDDTIFEDLRLTGIYSATVNLTADTYKDAKIEYKDQEFLFDMFTLAADKKVTFYFDPSTGIYYHNASDVEVETRDIYFDTQDTKYKNIFGAVATGEDVTYSIQTGMDVTSVKMVIKGKMSETILMDENDTVSKSGTKMWSTTARFAELGEYSYFFVIYNEAAITIYGDDDGYYGTGKASDLLNVMPYDQIVYQAGYETPDWMKKAVIYQIFPDRFFDGDVSNNRAQTSARGAVDYEYVTDWYTLPENPEQLGDYPGTYPANAWNGDGHWSNEIYGGDLKGITENISYLKALGVNVIYLNPVFASISNHRYDTSDYEYIDPVLGTEGDFDELVSIAEENDMYVILDGVFNHVSDDSKYFDRYYKYLEALKDSTEEKRAIGAYPFWAYVFDMMNEKGMAEEAAKGAATAFFEEEYGINDWTYTEWFDFRGRDEYVVDDKGKIVKDTIGLREGKPVYEYDGWWGYDSMPVIIATNGSEYQTPGYKEEIIGTGTDTNPESNITQYWLSKGMDGWRLDVANEVSDETWQKFRESVKALSKDNVIIGEIWTDAVEYLMGDMYDSVMNYVFRDAALNYTMGGNAENYIKTLEKLRERYPKEAFYAMMNLVGSHDTARVLSRLDGIEDDRKHPEDVKKAFPSYETTDDLAKQRQYLTAFLQFTYPGAPTIYYGDEIGMVGADDPDDRRAMTWGKGNKDIVEWYAKLGNTRNAYEVLQTGDIDVFESGSENVVSFVRSNEQSKMIVLANNEETAVDITVALDALSVAGTEFTDVISRETYTAASGSLTVSVPALSGLILTEAANVQEVTVDVESLKPAYDNEYTVADAKVTVSRTSANMNIGNTITLTATGRGTITWSTSNANVAAVDEDGVITANGSGRATITATQSDGLTATCVVTVAGSSGGSTTTPGGTTEEPKQETVAPLELPTQKREDGTVVTIVEAKGEYDFAATKVEGDLEISANGAVIKNLEMEAGSELVIKGKNVVIEDSDIKGTVSIPGGNASTITLNGTTAPKLVVEKPVDNSTKRVRLNISDNSSIEQLYVNAGTKIEITKDSASQAATTSKYAINNMYISVPEKAVVTLSGDYNKVTLSSKKTSLKLLEGKINKLTVKTTATNPDLILVKGTSITALTTTPKKASETLKYKSSNRKVVAVSGKGKVKAVKKGTANLTVTNSNGKAVKCKVTVK